ncbi:hypothetical protein LTR66_006757 [Elasticomyces elasticus]
MAAPSGKFFIQDNLKKVALHHENYKQLWETKWKKPCELGIYPFMFSSVKDFQPIVDKLVEVRTPNLLQVGLAVLRLTQQDFKEPYDWDEYAPMYFPKAEELVAAAGKAEKEGNKEKASELYL